MHERATQLKQQTSRKTLEEAVVSNATSTSIELSKQFSNVTLGGNREILTN